MKIIVLCVMWVCINFVTDPESGPAYDIRVLQRLLACNNVPQRLPFLSLSAREVSVQCHVHTMIHLN